MRRRHLLAVLVLLPAVAARAQEASPRTPVERLSDTLLDVMRRGQELGFAGRYRELQPVVAANLDLGLMARLAVGPAWTDLDAAQRDRLVKSFERYSVAQYAASFASYSGEKFELGDVAPRGSTGMVVHTRIVPANGDPTQIDYLVRQTDRQWRIIDVYLDGAVSQLAIRRSELGAVLKRNGFDGLITALEAKADQMAKQP